MTKHSSHPVDVHVGGRIRERRMVLGITQYELADEIGVTYQQVQKYETGNNRVSASRLADIAGRLNVNIAWFFADMGEDTPIPDAGNRLAIATMRDMARMTNPEHRKTVAKLARILAEADTAVQAA